MQDQAGLKDAISAINFAVDEADGENATFLKMWREGDWQGLAREFPEYDIPEYFVKALAPTKAI